MGLINLFKGKKKQPITSLIHNATENENLCVCVGGG